MFTNHILDLNVKTGLALNNQQRLICNKTKPEQTGKENGFQQ